MWPDSSSSILQLMVYFSFTAFVEFYDTSHGPISPAGFSPTSRQRSEYLSAHESGLKSMAQECESPSVNHNHIIGNDLMF